MTNSYKSRAVNVLDVEIEAIKKMISKYQKDLKELEEARSILVKGQPIKMGTQKKPGKKGPLASKILEILEIEGRELYINELLSLLEEKGRESKKSTLTVTMIRLIKDGLVERTKPNTFKLI